MSYVKRTSAARTSAIDRYDLWTERLTVLGMSTVVLDTHTGRGFLGSIGKERRVSVFVYRAT